MPRSLDVVLSLTAVVAFLPMMLLMIGLNYSSICSWCAGIAPESCP